jgi:hypothetical protein
VPLLLLLTISIRLQDDNANAFGWTFSGRDWWFNNPANDIAGYVGMTVTYPDVVQAGESLDVAVTFEYLDNDKALSDSVIFSEVQVHLSNASDRDSGEDIKDVAILNSEKLTFPLLRPGEQHTHVFSIYIPEVSEPVGTVDAAQRSSLGANQSQPVLLSNTEYVVDWSFSPLFSLGPELRIYQWDSRYYYDEGKIDAEELPPITIIDPSENQQRNLVIRVQEPYDIIAPVNVTIDGDKQYSVLPNGTKLSFQPNTVRTVEIPEFIAFPSNENIRAVFVNWSDGSYHAVSGDYTDNINKTIVRQVNLTKDIELYAIYKTQYYLDIVSSFDNNPDGEGWHDSGSTVPFSVEPMAAALTLNTFDRWDGDFSGTNAYSSIDMNSPKTVTAHWKFDLALVGGTTAAVLGVISIVKLFPPVIRRFRKGNDE